MRHNKNFNHLGRKTAHRKAMLSNMACSLIEHKRINTTVAKAKALRQFFEPLVTRSKDDTTHSRRVAFRVLGNKYAVTELFREVGPKVATRDGGYTRIIRTGNRLGDNAEMCLIELVDFNDVYGTEEKKKRSRRSRRGGAAKAAPVALPRLLLKKLRLLRPLLKKLRLSRLLLKKLRLSRLLLKKLQLPRLLPKKHQPLTRRRKQTRMKRKTNTSN